MKLKFYLIDPEKMNQKYAVKGRLPNNARIDWIHWNRVITVWSSDLEKDKEDLSILEHSRFFIEIDTSQLDEFSHTHQPAPGVLEIEGQRAPLKAKYEGGVIRYDSLSVPEFWLEVSVEEPI